MHESLRVAIVTTFPPGTGSLNEYAFHFVREMRRKRDVSELMLLVDELPDGATYPERAFADTPGAPTRFVPTWRFGALNNPWRIWRTVRRLRPDVVLFNIQFASFGSGKVASALGLMTPALLRRAGFPTVVLLHNIMETVDLRSAGFATNRIVEAVIRAAGRLVTRGLLSADLVALTIPKYVEILASEYGADNVMLAPHGTFDAVPTPDFSVPDGPRQIMTFGKFGTYKRVEALIEAFALLQADPARPPLELVIAGSDSPNAPGYLDAMATQYAQVPNVRFTGYVAEADVPGLFRAASAVVFPYTSTTGSSGVLHQAASFGRAVALPDLGDFSEVIAEEGYTGEFFAPDDPAGMAAAIGRIIDDPAHRVALGRRNYAAARGIPLADIVDWYLFHMHQLREVNNDGQLTHGTNMAG